MSCFSFYLFSFFFYKIREQEGRTGPIQGRRTGTSGREWVAGKGDNRMNMVQICVNMCVNAKMIPDETIPEIGGGK
jgi:hypothetical protein